LRKEPAVYRVEWKEKTTGKTFGDVEKTIRKALQ